ncbi:hypothetical protein H9W91_07270 [Streptomyces alfalfae]|uniref:hypothetical protein n=1 Tax=Streptomyces alfalfae TaxID=1642299 RepID=UPI001BA9580B|nr:hypothetical protein [Streptomyces alfalfae]QUI30679.1 hypothetical protein H9W91_07270 [Streptomyces alfalfae]
MRAFRVRVEIHRAENVAGAYTSRRDWENASVVWSGFASVQPDRAFEYRSPERETSQIRQLVHLPPGADVEATDRIQIRGEMHEIEGEPLPWKFGSLSHIQVKAWKVKR